MNNEPTPFSSEPSDKEFDDALRHLQEDADEFEPMFEEMKRATLINERLAMEALHLAGLPVHLFEGVHKALGLDVPVEETLKMLIASEQALGLEEDSDADPEVAKAIDTMIQLGFIIQQMASNKSLHDMSDPVMAAEVRQEEQLNIINDRTLSHNDRERVLRAINLLYEDGTGLEMTNPDILLAAEEQRTLQAYTEAVKDTSRVMRDSLKAIANEYMNTLGVIEHDDKEDFITSLVVAISRECVAETAELASINPLGAEATKQASALQIELSLSQARQFGLTDEQFNELIVLLRHGSTPQ